MPKSYKLLATSSAISKSARSDGWHAFGGRGLVGPPGCTGNFSARWVPPPCFSFFQAAVSSPDVPTGPQTRSGRYLFWQRIKLLYKLLPMYSCTVIQYALEYTMEIHSTDRRI